MGDKEKLITNICKSGYEPLSRVRRPKLEWVQSYLKNFLSKLVYSNDRCFATLVDVIAEYAKEGLINETLHADDLVVMSESMENLGERGI